MKPTIFTTLLLLSHVVLCAQERPAAAEAPISLLPGMGSLHHPIATNNPEVQRFFDQGLTLIYGFNHQEAVRSFRRASELDNKSAMPWWGIALALGPNYNMDVDPESEKAAYEAIQKALKLAANGSAIERDYVHALAQRYSNDPNVDYHKLAVAYRDAMRQVASQYPDDPDAVTLYAESMMDLRPWQLWSADGKPAEDTEEIVAQLETVLRAYPEHIGANHYYIHAVEASPHPERALPSAARLARLVPKAGHLVHMPSHIYERTGDYDLAVAANLAAVRADREYVERSGTQGSLYDLMYFTHNLQFLMAACSMQGNSRCAIESAKQMAEHIAPGVKQMPMLECFMAWQPLTLARFQQWTNVLMLPAPDAALTMDSGAWHYARGLAYVSKDDKEQARLERKALADIMEKTPPDAPFGLNSAKTVLTIAVDILDGKLAAANGDIAGATEYYRKAVGLQDQMNYDEPPDWYYPVRETLGAALLRNGDAAGAEAIFRADLVRNPRNGRSLYGLCKALESQNKTIEAAWVQGQFDQAWAKADVQPNLAEF